ncbi:MAG: SagB/ThcOx family dehydrogenase [Planctomycetaceae bacterium]|nr:SagB/ThcOx family dehydrogenase [Planctomycetaceae bacterium]
MICMTLLLTFVSAPVFAQDIQLPEPQKTGGKPLFDAISERETNRNISPEALDLQTISDVMWAAYGFNREDKRVIPTANNKQELMVYAVLEEGVYFYDAKDNKLILKAKGDHRVASAGQDFANTAPLNIVYVVDYAKGTDAFQSGIACGAAAQNVYLACASKGLGCVIRTTIDRDEMSKILNLEEKQEVVAGQTVGKIAP